MTLQNTSPSLSNNLVMAGLIAGLLTVSCSDSTQPLAPTQSPPVQSVEVGRYQILVTPQGDLGTKVFLLDTLDGRSWIYQPPQGQAINGFWSDIPRLTYPPDHWLRIFTQQQQPQPAAPPVPTPEAPGQTAPQTGAAPPVPTPEAPDQTAPQTGAAPSRPEFLSSPVP